MSMGAAILEVLRLRGEPMTSTQVDDALMARGLVWSNRTVRSRLIKMANAGDIEHVRGGYVPRSNVTLADRVRIANMVRAYGLDVVLDAARSEHERLAEVSR